MFSIFHLFFLFFYSFISSFVISVTVFESRLMFLFTFFFVCFGFGFWGRVHSDG